MKYILTSIICFFVSVFAYANTRIVMERDGDLYKIPCLVNGAKMKLLFDTGASSVSISLPIAEYLYENGYITDADFKGKGQTIVADGGIVDHLEIVIRDIEISGKHLKNVEAVVISNQNAPLLLGQSAIRKLGPIQLNGNILTILDSTVSNKAKGRGYDQGQIEEMLRQASDFFLQRKHGKASAIYQELYDNGVLEEKYVHSLGCAYYFMEEYEKCITILQTIENRTALDLKLIGAAFSYQGDYESAINCYQQTVLIYKQEDDFLNAAEITGYIAEEYDKMKKYSEAVTYWRRAIRLYERAWNFAPNTLWEACISTKFDHRLEQVRKDDMFKAQMELYIWDLYFNNEITESKVYNLFAALAKNKFKNACDWCDRNNIPY